MSAQPWTIEHSGPRDSYRVTVEQAFRIAAKFAHRTPKWTELRDEYGMSRATAYRWVKSIKAARGEE